MMFYLIVYAWRRIGDRQWHYANLAVDTDPYDWLLSTRAYESEVYVLLNFFEIDEVTYNKINQLVN